MERNNWFNSGILARMTLLKWEIHRKLYQTTKSLLKTTNRHMSRINTIYRHIITITKRWMKVNERSKTFEYMNKLNKGTRLSKGIMEVQASRIIYMFKQYNMWRREKIEEILLRRKIRSIYIKKCIENIIKEQKVY